MTEPQTWNAAIQAAIEAAEGERLRDNTETEEDKAYTFAIDCVVQALRGLLKDGES